MGKLQNEFPAAFKERFARRFGEVQWSGGQREGNTASLVGNLSLRHNNVMRNGEAFELGDARCDYARRTIIIEYDSGQVALSNLLKYWPYIRGEL